MYELQMDGNGSKVLVWVERDRLPGERGRWVEIGRERDKGISFIVAFNRSHGVEVEKDEKGIYRALILKD